MSRLTDLLASMGWAAVLCFTLALMVGLCGLVLLIDAWRHREPKRLRIHKRHIDASYSTGQFSVPYSQRDFKP